MILCHGVMSISMAIKIASPPSYGSKPTPQFLLELLLHCGRLYEGHHDWYITHLPCAV